MFTIADIRDIAIQIERNGEKVYEQAGHETADPELAATFRWLAGEERRHARFFAAMTAEAPLSPEQSELETMGRALLQEMVREKTFSLDREDLKAATDLAEVVRQAKVFEEDTILFYEFLYDIVDDEATRRQLAVIIAEEHRHVELLAGMMDDLQGEGSAGGDR